MSVGMDLTYQVAVFCYDNLKGNLSGRNFNLISSLIGKSGNQNRLTWVRQFWFLLVLRVFGTVLSGGRIVLFGGWLLCSLCVIIDTFPFKDATSKSPPSTHHLLSHHPLPQTRNSISFPSCISLH